MQSEILDDNKVVIKGEITNEDLLNTYKKNILKSTFSFTIIGVIILVLGLSFLIAFFANKDKDMAMYGAFMLAVGALIVLMPFIFMLIIPKLLSKQNRGLINGFLYKYVFTNDNISVVLHSEETKTSTAFNYSLVYKCRIYGDIVCIYINSNVVYMFNINSFENEEDKIYVMQKLDKKYKVKNND